MLVLRGLENNGSSSYGCDAKAASVHPRHDEWRCELILTTLLQEPGLQQGPYKIRQSAFCIV